ncbi:MAG: uncharacterized protein QOF76_4290 [Solirubrobacteraceae bacterium]|jgi:uncharacterized membrane protein YfcA|nr:uncharacterized protein [Solirubrobacteraceae bacterium]
MDAVAAILLGVGAGAVAGLLGVGGGILFVPALTLVLGLGQVDAEATSLLAIIPVSALGTYRQHGYGNVNLREGLVIGALGAGGVAAGVALANALPQHVLRLGFAGLMLFVAARLFRRPA